jgi:hypothetical protein
MQLSRIKKHAWYSTTQGDGKCVGMTLNRVQVEIAGKVHWLAPKEVKAEIAEGQEPKADPSVSIVDILETVRRHLTDLEEAWRAGALTSCDGNNSLRANRNVEVRVLLEKLIAHEKGESA